MLLVIHNLPPHMRYADVKSLIISRCGVKEVILDNLVNDGQSSKKVTVGVAEEEDAATLVRQMNGMFLEGRQLYVQDARQKKSSEQPFQQTRNNYESSNVDTQGSYNQQSNYSTQMNYPQPMDYQQAPYTNQMPGFQQDNQQVMNSGPVKPMIPVMGGMKMGAPYYMQQCQNSYMDYTDRTQQFPSSFTQYPQFPVQQEQSGSGTKHLIPNEDKWSQDRRAQGGTSQEDNDKGYGNESTYETDSGQLSRRWARSGDNKRERSSDRSWISPKRARNEDLNRDFTRRNSNSNNNSQRYGPNETYTSQTYESRNQNEPYTSQSYNNSNQNKPYSSQSYDNSNQNKPHTSQSYNSNQSKPYYLNDPITATSSDNPQSFTSLPASRQWNAGTGFSNSTPVEDKSQVGSRNVKDTSSLDSKSNYRNHMLKKAEQSKHTWKNPAKTSYNLRNNNTGNNDATPSSRGGQSRARDEDKPLQRNNPQINPTERYSSHKQQPMNDYLPRKRNKKNKRKVLPIIKEDSALRFKAACQIAIEIANAHPDIIKQEYFKHLRQSVRSRFEVLLGEELGEPLPVMIAKYRSQFPASTDLEFCKNVVKDIPAESKTAVNLTEPTVKTEGIKQQNPSQGMAKNQSTAGKSQPTAGKGQPSADKGQPSASYIQPNANPNPVMLPRLKLPDPAEKLPKYPNANKQVYKEQKKLKKLEHQTEDLYELSPLLQQALDEELQTITDIFKSVITKPDQKVETEFCEHFLNVGLEQVRKVTKLHVTKRLLNINTNLIIRVLISGKQPKKTEVEMYLRKLNVVSMKKSEKRKGIYIATCNDFATYDRLCELQIERWKDGTVIQFKPFQLVGPKLSFRERNELRSLRMRGLVGKAANDLMKPNANVDNDAEQHDEEETGHDSQEGQYGQDDQHDDEVADDVEADIEDIDVNEADLEDY